MESDLGLDSICSAKFEQNGQPEERSNSSSKMGCQFAQKRKQNGERMSSLPAKLLESSKAIGFRLVLLVQPSLAAAERVSQSYNNSQLSSSHLWRTT